MRKFIDTTKSILTFLDLAGKTCLNDSTRENHPNVLGKELHTKEYINLSFYCEPKNIFETKRLIEQVIIPDQRNINWKTGTATTTVAYSESKNEFLSQIIDRNPREANKIAYNGWDVFNWNFLIKIDKTSHPSNHSYQ